MLAFPISALAVYLTPTVVEPWASPPTFTSYYYWSYLGKGSTPTIVWRVYSAVTLALLLFFYAGPSNACARNEATIFVSHSHLATTAELYLAGAHAGTLSLV